MKYKICSALQALEELEQDNLHPKQYYSLSVLQALHEKWDDEADMQNICLALENCLNLAEQTLAQIKRNNNMSEEEALTMAFVAMMITNAGQDKDHPVCPWTFQRFLDKVMYLKPSITVPQASAYWEKVMTWDSDILPEIMDYDRRLNNIPVKQNNNG